MGISGIGVGELLLILLIVLLLFGGSKLSRIGSDLGTAIRGFRSALQGEGKEESPPPPDPHPGGEKNPDPGMGGQGGGFPTNHNPGR